MMDKRLKKIQGKATILADALPYLRDFNQKIIVIGYLGSNCLSADQEQEVMRDIALLQSVGMKLIIVHDTRMGSDKFRENKRIAKLVEFCGPKAVGLCGIDEQTLHMTLDNNYIPVITPNDIDTEHIDINPADTAMTIASLLNAEKLVYLGKYEGIHDHDNNRILSMTRSELRNVLDEDISDPVFRHLLENAYEALGNGVARVHLVNGSLPHSLLLELFSIYGIGTVIMGDERKLYKHEKQKKEIASFSDLH